MTVPAVLRLTAAVMLATASIGLAGCGANPYQSECVMRVNTESLQHGVTRARAIAECERQQARQS